MGEDEVRIPIFLDVQDGDVTPKLQKLKGALKEIVDTRSNQIKNPFDAWQLTKAIKGLEAIRDRVHQVGEENLSDREWQKLTNATLKNLETLDRLVNKYEVLKNTMIGMPKNWVPTDNARELTQYIDALNSRLQQTKTMLSAIPQGVSEGDAVVGASKARIEEEVKALEQLISKIGEYQSALAESEKNARDRTSEVSQMKKDGGYATEAIEAQKRIAKAARDAYSEMEKDSAQATQALKRDVQERIRAIQDETAELQNRIETLKNTPMSGEDARRPSHRTVEEEENLADATDRNAEANNREATAMKNSTAQYYYKLRAIKMLGHTIDQAKSAVDNFGKKSLSVATSAAKAYLKLIPGVTALSRVMSNSNKAQTKFNRNLKTTAREIGSATKANDGFNFSVKKTLTFLLKYTLGIRSLFIAYRKLKQAAISGLGEMSKQFDDVNARMSTILTEINYMKASLTAMVEPLVTLLAPAFERLGAIVAKVSYYVASFISAFTGQQMVYKAVKVQADYAASLDKTAKNAKKARKELAGFDELNVLHSNDDDDEASALGWELVPAMEEAMDWANKIKEFLKTLFEPLKNAWEKMKDFVLNSWNYMIEKIKSLLGTIWDDLIRVWKDPKTQKIFEDLLKIVGDVFLIIGNIAEAIEEAWKHNDNGYRILSAIRDIIGIIVEGIRECADYTVEWSKKLDLIPLFDAIANVLEQQVVPAVEKVKDLFVYLYEQVLLEFVRYCVEELGPILVETFGNIVEAAGNLAENLREALELDDKGVRIVQSIEDIITIIAEGIKECSEATKEWAKEIDFNPLLEAVAEVLENKIKPAVEKIKDLAVWLYENVVLEIGRYLIEDLGPKAIEIFGNITEVVGNIAEKVRIALEENDRGKNILAEIEKIANIVADAILKCSEKTAEWAKNLDFGNLFDSILNFLKQIEPAVKAITDMVSQFWTNVLLPFWKYMIEDGGPKLLDLLGKIFGPQGDDGLGIDWEHLKKVVGEFLDTFEDFLELAWETFLIVLKDIGKAFDDILNSKALDWIVEHFKNWVKDADPEELAHKLETAVKWFLEAKIALDLLSKVIMPAVTGFMTFGNFLNMAGIGSKLGEISTAVGTGSGGGLAGALSGIAVPIAIAIGAIALLVGAFGGVKETIAEVKERFDKFVDTMKDFVEKSGLKEGLDAIKSKFSEFTASLEKLRPVAEFLLDIIFQLATEIGEVLVSAIDGLLTAVGGVIDIATGIIDVLAGLGETLYGIGEIIVGLVTGDFDLLGKGFDDIGAGITDLENGAFKIFKGAIEAITGLIEGLLDVVAVNFPQIKDTVFQCVNDMKSAIFGWIDETEGKVSAWINTVLNLFKNLKYQLIGDPIVYDIRDGIIGGFGEFISNTLKSVGGWITDVTKDFSDMKAGLAQKISDTKESVVNGFTTLKEGLLGQSKEATTTTEQDFTTMDANIKSDINATSLVTSGTEYIQGLQNGVNTQFPILTEDMNAKLLLLHQSFINIFNLNTLYIPGTELITGLQTGINDTWLVLQENITLMLNDMLLAFTTAFNLETLYQTGIDTLLGFENGLTFELPATLLLITQLCEEIINATKTAFGIGESDIKNDSNSNSVISSVFLDFGKSLMNGLNEGIIALHPTVVESVNKLYSEIIEATIKFTEEFNIKLDEFISTTSKKLEDYHKSVMQLLKNFRKELKDHTEDVSKLLKDYTEGVLKLFKQFIEDIKKDLDLLYEEIKKSSIRLLTLMAQSLELLFNLCADTVELITTLFYNTLNDKTLYETGQQLIVGLMEGISSQHSSLMSMIAQETKNVKNAFVGDATSLNMNQFVSNFEYSAKQYEKQMESAAKTLRQNASSIYAKYRALMNEKASDDQYTIASSIPVEIDGETVLLPFWADSTDYRRGRGELETAIATYKSQVSDLKREYNNLFDLGGNDTSNGLNQTTLFVTGRNVIEGLIKGMQSAEGALWSYIEKLCGEIKRRINKALDIKSPSKFTYGVGEYLMEGMRNGIADNREMVEDEFSDIALTPDDKFENRFLDNLINMKNTAVDIIADMANRMETVMSNIDFLSSIETMQSSLQKIDSIKIPDIVTGKVLPSTTEFSSNTNSQQTVDANSIAKAVKDALIESMEDMRYNNTDNQDIVVQIDGYEVFRAMRNQSDMFRYATGYGAL